MAADDVSAETLISDEFLSNDIQSFGMLTCVIQKFSGEGCVWAGGGGGGAHHAPPKSLILYKYV